MIKDNRFKDQGIDLAGVAIGNGWVRPYDQYGAYAPFAFDNKLINTIGKYALTAAMGVCQMLVKFDIPVVNQYYCGIVTQLVMGVPGFPRFNIYDIRKKCDNPPLCYDFSALDEFLNRKDV